VQVVTTDGDELGRVHDAVLVQDGPMGAQGRAGLRLHAIAVGSRSLGSQLGYAQGTVQGPWLLRRLLGRAPRLLPWRAIVARDGQRILVDLSRISEQE